MNQWLIKLMTSFLLFLMIFMIHCPKVEIFLIIIISFWGIQLIRFRKTCNCEFHNTISACIFGSVFAYCVESFSETDSISVVDIFEYINNFNYFGFLNSRTIIVACIVAFIVEFIAYRELTSQAANCKKNIHEALFPERIYDLRRFKNILKNSNTVGINSKWGNGKTFMVTHFCNETATKNEYYIIKIEALTYNYDEFDTVLVNKLEYLLRKHHIFSSYSIEIKKTFGQSFWGTLLYNYLHDWKSGNITAYEGLQKELCELNKKVIIIFEDIERVNHPDAVKKVFAIAEKLSCNRVKFIFEYNSEALDEQHIDREYRNRYIPYELNLTQITYKKMINYLWDNLDMESINREINNGAKHDIKYLVEYLEIECHSNNALQNLFRNKLTIQVKFPKYPIRNMIQFLQLIKMYFELYSDIDIDEIKTVIGFYFIQTFAYNIYEKFSTHKPLEEIFKFNIDGEEQTIYEIKKLLVNNPDKEQSILDQIRKSQESILVYGLFPYIINDFDLKIKYEKEKENRDIPYNDQIYLLECQERRDSINHRIWNLLENGVSEISDIRAFAEKFVKQVLLQSEQQKAWVAFQNDTYNNKIFKDNHTIFLIGVPQFITLARALFLNHSNSDIWLRFIKFYFNETDCKSIDYNFIVVCNYIDLQNPQILFYIIEKFIKLKVIGNFNSAVEYRYFLNKYIKCMAYFGYMRYISFDFLDFDCNEDLTDFIICTLKRASQNINTEFSDFNQKYKNECDLLRRFFDKNIDIINNGKELKKPEPHMEFKEGGITYPHQKRINELLKFINEKDKSFESSLELLSDYYDKGELFPQEVNAIIHEIHAKKGK